MSQKVKEQALIWGAGFDGKMYKWRLMPTHDTVGWVDNDIKKQGTLVENIPVYSASDILSKFEKETLVLICSRAYKDIQKQLSVMGFKNVICSKCHVEDFWSNLVRGIFFPKDEESYSTWGEDLIVNAIFRTLQTCPPRYAEIGVRSPIVDSNTYLFYKQDISKGGILVEADPAHERDIRIVRPNDKYHAVGIGVSKGELKMYHTKNGMSSFDCSVAEHWQSLAGLQEQEMHTTTVPVVTFDDVFLNEGIQYLSIDIEGWDEPVLCSIDFQKYPELMVIVTEAIVSTNVRTHMQNSGFVFFALTRDNVIFLRESVLEQVLVSYECRRIYEFMKFIENKEIPWIL
jgi:FkbM family methyltransferase